MVLGGAREVSSYDWLYSTRAECEEERFEALAEETVAAVGLVRHEGVGPDSDAVLDALGQCGALEAAPVRF